MKTSTFYHYSVVLIQDPGINGTTAAPTSQICVGHAVTDDRRKLKYKIRDERCLQFQSMPNLVEFSHVVRKFKMGAQKQTQYITRLLFGAFTMKSRKKVAVSLVVFASVCT